MLTEKGLEVLILMASTYKLPRASHRTAFDPSDLRASKVIVYIRLVLKIQLSYYFVYVLKAFQR